MISFCLGCGVATEWHADQCQTGQSYWNQRHSGLYDVEDDDQVFDVYKKEWGDSYRAEFLRFALSRKWVKEDAESWPDELCEDALLWSAPNNFYCPIKTAQQDVLACEQESQC